jgi:hypothetical protein
MVDTPISKLPAAGTLIGDEPIIISQRSTTVTMSAATISALASDNSFNDSANGFIAEGFSVGDYVNVSGFTGDVANNIFSAEITALTAGKMTIGGTDGNVIVDDAAGETVVISKWESKQLAIEDLPFGSGSAGFNLIDTDGTIIDYETVTITIATPGVVTLAGHGFAANQAVIFATTGALPTGLVAGTTYYVRNPATNTFEVSATVGGASINTTGSQSGVHSVRKEATWSYSAAVAQVDVIGLAGYTDFLILGRNITLSVAGNRAIYCSVDNGATFYTASGNYVVISNVGAETNTECIATEGGSSVATVRSFQADLLGFGVNAGLKATNHLSQNVTRAFVASTLAVNALRLSRLGAGGNLTGGVLYVYAK